jgi:hypothetical protein
MQQQWVADLPSVVLFIIGIGGLAGALLAIVKLWREFIPDGNSALARDISSIKTDMHDVRKRVGMLEIDLARIDQPAIARRLDSFEQKIDRLHDLLIDRGPKHT